MEVEGSLAAKSLSCAGDVEVKSSLAVKRLARSRDEGKGILLRVRQLEMNVCWRGERLALR